VDYIAGRVSPLISAIAGDCPFREAKHANVINEGY
jgi:hypothetical protein